MNNPKISVIVPVYNTEDYLDRCVKSIVNQTYDNIEIILVDDGSPDNCPTLCDKWAEEDGRIKSFHKKNGGLSDARNYGFSEAAGDYVLFVDSDDYIEPDMIEFLYSLAEKNGADVSRCGFYFDFEDSGEEKENPYSKDEKIFEYNERIKDLVLSGHVSGVVWNKLYKREFISDIMFEPEDGSSEDILFNYRVYRKDPKTVFCDMPKYHYAVRNGSITKSKFGYGAFDIVRAKRIITEFEKDNAEILPFVHKGYVISAFIVLSGCIRNNACMDRFDELRDSILQYKSEIFSSGLYSKTEKLKTFLLSVSPGLYKVVNKMKS